MRKASIRRCLSCVLKGEEELAISVRILAFILSPAGTSEGGKDGIGCDASPASFTSAAGKGTEMEAQKPHWKTPARCPHWQWGWPNQDRQTQLALYGKRKVEDEKAQDDKSVAIRRVRPTHHVRPTAEPGKRATQQIHPTLSSSWLAWLHVFKGHLINEVQVGRGSVSFSIFLKLQEFILITYSDSK